MGMACSSVLRGGGTNQELVLHCLHECGGDILVSTAIQSGSLSFQDREKISASSKRLDEQKSFK